MNPEGEYARSKYLQFHRWSSILVVAVAAVAYASRFSIGTTIRSFAAFVAPLILIWFSDELALWAIRDSGGWLNARNADSIVRLMAWLILLILLALRGMVWHNV